MKINLDFSAKLVKNSFGKGKHGFTLSLNGDSLTFRKRHNFEDDSIGKDGSVVYEGKKSHWFLPERKGLYFSALIKLPKNACVSIYKNGMSYGEAVGMEKMTLDWVLDEFDSSFDQLAIGSMRYHMDWAVTSCSPKTRELYLDLIERLEKYGNGASFSEEEIAHLGECRKIREDAIEKIDKCGRCKDIYSSFSNREDEYRKIHTDVRKEFVDIMPSLWS